MANREIIVVVCVWRGGGGGWSKAVRPRPPLDTYSGASSEALLKQENKENIDLNCLYVINLYLWNKCFNKLFAVCIIIAYFYDFSHLLPFSHKTDAN